MGTCRVNVAGEVYKNRQFVGRFAPNPRKHGRYFASRTLNGTFVTAEYTQELQRKFGPPTCIIGPELLEAFPEIFGPDV